MPYFFLFWAWESRILLLSHYSFFPQEDVESVGQTSFIVSRALRSMPANLIFVFLLAGPTEAYREKLGKAEYGVSTTSQSIPESENSAL